MGGNSSKRRVVVEDAGPDAVVTVTEDVVRRLKGMPDKPATETNQSHSSKSSSSERIPEPTPRQEPQSNDSPKKESPGLTMQDVEAFYLEKLKDLQNRNAVLQQQTNQQFATAVKEVENKFINFTSSPVCQDLQKKVMECYQNNGTDTLNCSAVVNAFTACVDKARMAASVNRVRNISSS